MGVIAVGSSDTGVATVRLDGHVPSHAQLQGAGVGERVRRQLLEYFAGERTVFEVPLDWGDGGGFRRVVQKALLDIAYGRTESYGELAARVGNAGAVRAVGTACATNPLPIIVPCHRVVRSDGSLGNYAGGVEMKRWLLAHEARG